MIYTYVVYIANFANYKATFTTKTSQANSHFHGRFFEEKSKNFILPPPPSKKKNDRENKVFVFSLHKMVVNISSFCIFFRPPVIKI